MIHTQIEQRYRVVSHTAGQVIAILRQVQRCDFALQHDIVGRAIGTRIPEANFLIEMARNDGRPGAVRRHQIIATGAGKFRLDTGTTAQVPYFEGPIMRSGHHFRWFAQKFGRHHFATVTGQCVLRVRKENML